MAAQLAIQEVAQEKINGRLYRTANLVRNYAYIKLFPSEATAFIRYHDAILGQRVLDMGCGAGRLATYLRPLVDEYVGTDISRHMIQYCRQTYPGLEFIQTDMRAMPQIEDESFDTVLAVANLFDAVSHAERRQVLAEVRRILKPGGLLMFSGHNRRHTLAGHGPTLMLHRNPVTQLRLIVDYVQATINHLRIKPLHHFEDEYALLNDCGNNYHTLHYYITREGQARQLDVAGFELLESISEFGETLGPNDRDDFYSSIMYIARRL